MKCNLSLFFSIFTHQELEFYFLTLCSLPRFLHRILVLNTHNTRHSGAPRAFATRGQTLSFCPSPHQHKKIILSSSKERKSKNLSPPHPNQENKKKTCCPGRTPPPPQPSPLATPLIRQFSLLSYCLSLDINIFFILVTIFVPTSTLLVDICFTCVVICYYTPKIRGNSLFVKGFLLVLCYCQLLIAEFHSFNLSNSHI